MPKKGLNFSIQESLSSFINGDFCLWETEDQEFKVGIIGTGPGFKTILTIIRQDSLSEFLPSMRLSALAEPGPERHKLAALGDDEVPIYGNYGEMIVNHPEINLLIELTGAGARLSTIRRSLPLRISLIDHKTVVFLCGLHNMLASSEHFRQSLERHQTLFRAIIDEVKEDIILLDKNMRVADMNKNVLERTGKTKEELMGKPCWEVQTLDDKSTFCSPPCSECPFHNTIKTKEKSENLITRVDSEGRLRYFRIYSYPILNRFGGLDYIMMLRRDITRRTYREKHQQQREKLTVIGEMSTYLAHEIRNPLFAIAGFTRSLLASEGLNEKQKEKLNIVLDEAKRLDNLLACVLNFAKPADSEADHIADLSEVVKETVDLMRIGYAGQGYEIETELADNSPKVRGEPEMVKQCLINLIKNAVEAMPGGGPIKIRTKMSGDWLILEVEDKGVGMSEHEMDKVFSPFYSTKTQGYGLGLAMIKKIIEDSGGRVELQSREGAGTTVTLYFAPVLAVMESEEGPDQASRN